MTNVQFLHAIGKIAAQQGQQFYTISIDMEEFIGWRGEVRGKTIYTGYINPLIRYSGDTPESVIEQFNNHYASARALTCAEDEE